MSALFGVFESNATVELDSGDALDVREFDARDAMSRLFDVRLVLVSRNLDLDFDAILGLSAAFRVETPTSRRTWRGIAVAMDQVRVDKDGLATYELTIAPRLHLLGLRKNYRIFQFKSELEIVTQILGEWGVQHRVLANAGEHKQRKFRVQYGESDLVFITRMLEDAGIAYWFDGEDGASTMVLDDRPASRDVGFPGLRFHDKPGVTDDSVVTAVSLAERVRPGKRTIGDLDYRRGPTHQPVLSAAEGRGPEARLEQYDYEPGAFLFVGGSGGNTPTADDRGATRTDESAGAAVAHRRHLGDRNDAQRMTLRSNVVAVGPGKLLSVVNHPHHAVDSASWLALESRVHGSRSSEWSNDVGLSPSTVPYFPRRETPKPVVNGLESATVVGPSADEIHTDEFGRVRVHFHWDRESGRNETSSCWIPTSQPWAGAGFGGTVLPRIGQEVLVEFLGGDPDRPVVMGRVFTERQPAPYPLPSGKKLTGLVGRTTPSLVLGGSAESWMVQQSEERGGPLRAPGAGGREFSVTRPKDFPNTNRDNAFLLNDAQHQDLVYLQAKKDLNFVVKHAWRSVIGNYRGCMVNGTDDLFVRNKQHNQIIAHQLLRVDQNQAIVVDHVRDETVDQTCALVVEKAVTADITGPFELVSHNQAISVEADELITLQVGDSSIIITKETIVIDSPRVDVNPK